MISTLAFFSHTFVVLHRVNQLVVMYFDDNDDDDDDNEDDNDKHDPFCHIILVFFIVSINQHDICRYILMMTMSFVT